MIKSLSILAILAAAALPAWGQKTTSKRDVPRALVVNHNPNRSFIAVPTPVYPEAARAVNASGRVVVRILIDEKGNVEKAEIESGHPLLRAAAITAALGARYKLLRLSGKPVRVATTLEFNFTADGQAAVSRDTDLETPVLNGMAREMSKPDYPLEARERCVGGKVEVEVEINEKGDVISAKAVSGDELLQEAAVEAARKTTFQMKFATKQHGYLVYNFDPFVPKNCEEKIPVMYLGPINEKATYLPMPKMANAGHIKRDSEILVRVTLDMQKGVVLNAEMTDGHPLMKSAAEAAARRAKFQPSLNEFAMVRGVGFITYRVSDLNKPAVVNKSPRKFAIIIQDKDLSGRTIRLPKPEAMRQNGRLVKGDVKVMLLIEASTGKVIATRAASGPEELRGPSEKAAMKVAFSQAHIDGGGGPPLYVLGFIVYRF